MPFSIRPFRRYPVQCPSRTARDHFKDMAPCGILRVLVGDSLVTRP
jgi:hypothetical protein